MSKQKFERYGNDRIGHWFYPAEENETSGSSGSGGPSLGRFFAICIAIVVVAFMLRAANHAGTAQVATATGSGGLTRILTIAGAVVLSLIAIGIVLLQMLVAYRDRGEYWLLRLLRAATTQGPRLLRFFGLVLKPIWWVAKPLAKWTTQVTIDSVAWFVRAIRAFKGRYYLPSPHELNEALLTAQEPRRDRAQSCAEDARFETDGFIDPKIAEDLERRKEEIEEMIRAVKETTQGPRKEYPNRYRSSNGVTIDNKLFPVEAFTYNQN